MRKYVNVARKQTYLKFLPQISILNIWQLNYTAVLLLDYIFKEINRQLISEFCLVQSLNTRIYETNKKMCMLQCCYNITLYTSKLNSTCRRIKRKNSIYPGGTFSLMSVINFGHLYIERFFFLVFIHFPMQSEKSKTHPITKKKYKCLFRPYYTHDVTGQFYKKFHYT